MAACHYYAPEMPVQQHGLFPRLLSLLRKLLSCRTTPAAIIPFRPLYNDNGDRLFSTPWNTEVYASYADSAHNGQVVLIEIFSDGATISKSGTQISTFIRLRFSNIRPHREDWHTVGLAPSPTTTTSPRCWMKRGANLNYC